MSSQTVIWWIKKDFRLRDNPALMEALANHERVMPLFLFEPAILQTGETSAFHVAAWCEALTELEQNLKDAGGSLLILQADAREAFEQIHSTLPIQAVYSHEEIGSEVTYARDREMKSWFSANNIAWHELRQTGVFRGRLDRDKRAGRWREFMQGGPLPSPPEGDIARITMPDLLTRLENRIQVDELKAERFGHPLSEEARLHRQPVSEAAAHITLNDFLTDRGICYSGGISSPNDAFECGSRLSVHLAWGTITGRDVYAATEMRRDELEGKEDNESKQWRKSLRSFTSRLHWRDHFIQRLESEPQMEFEPLNAAYEALPTPGDEHLGRWLAGRTGWPLVDACMRCAAATGFLNFRMRALVLSIAVHSLRIDWRKTLYPLARLWADYEPGIHIAQTQMQAGVVGINQLRIYSPDKQLSDHDKDARFVKRWVPELREVSAREIRNHHLNPVESYPAPMLDWRESSRQMRSDYYEIKQRPETRALAEIVYAKHGSRKPARSRRPSKKRKRSDKS